MTPRNDAPGAQTLALWKRLAPMPGGRWLFGLALARLVPYSATVHPRVEALEPGHVRVSMRDRPGLRNHLGSLHALALANLGELTSGLAMTTSLPAGVRSIVVGLSIAFVKKARGTITAEANVTVPEVRGDVAHAVEAILRDAGGDEVARVHVDWRLSPRP